MKHDGSPHCIWDGGYLPTEAEWNYAAAGGSEQRAPPWSSPADNLTLAAAHAAFYDKSACGSAMLPACPGVIDVDTKPLGDGRFDQSDLGGNVYEPTLDAYAYQYPTPCADCASLKAKTSMCSAGAALATQTYISVRAVAICSVRGNELAT